MILMLSCRPSDWRAGSRSSPLALAIALHPRARLEVCIDERSLGFFALGYGRATGCPAAVVTSSGTAVANLLPAAVEASMSHVPLLLLTADRPFEVMPVGPLFQCTGSNLATQAAAEKNVPSPVDCESFAAAPLYLIR